jgi:hypothetical protein
MTPEVTWKTKYLRFVVIARKEKTTVWAVESISTGNRLGIVEWYGQYTFTPDVGTVYNGACLGHLRLFVDSRMKDHRNHLAGKGTPPRKPTNRVELKRDLRALRERYLLIEDSEEPEDKEEKVRLLRLHEDVRMQLIDVGEDVG